MVNQNNARLHIYLVKYQKLLQLTENFTRYSYSPGIADSNYYELWSLENSHNEKKKSLENCKRLKKDACVSRLYVGKSIFS